MWANKGECQKNPAFMAAGCAQACHRWEEARKDKDPKCAEWAANGDCDTRQSFMSTNCKTSCLRALEDQLVPAACAAVVGAGACNTTSGLVQCRGSCLRELQARLSGDTEGNCWYWGTDGECANNSVWMRQTCPLTCAKLAACGGRDAARVRRGPRGPPSAERAARTRRRAARARRARRGLTRAVLPTPSPPCATQLGHHDGVSAQPASDTCAQPFECPVANDERADCAARARRGECRSASPWVASSLTRSWCAATFSFARAFVRCLPPLSLGRSSLSCHLLDPPSVSHSVTRPAPRTSAWVDVAHLLSCAPILSPLP